MRYPYPRPTAEEMDQSLVDLGFITEEERIQRGYRRILQRMYERRSFAVTRPDH